MSVSKSNSAFSYYLNRFNLSALVVVLACIMACASIPNAFAAKSNESVVVNSTVNINKASSEEIAQILSGVGIKKAEAIVAYRVSNGEFKSVDDLLNVKGIGASTLEKNRSLIKI